MLPPPSPASPRAARDLVARQRRHNHVLAGMVGLVVLANVALVTAAVLAAAHDPTPALIVAGGLVALMACCAALYKPLALGRVGSVALPGERARLQAIVNDLAGRLRVPAPQVRIAENAPNAIAFGSGPRSVIVFTTGLLDLLGDDEEALRAVAAHEIAHVAGRDSWLGTVAHGLLQWIELVGVLVMGYAWALDRVCRGFLRATGTSGGPIVGSLRMGCWACAVLVAPVLHWIGSVLHVPAHLIFLGLCRQREFAADGTAACLTGGPEALCRALALLDEADTSLLRGRRLAQDQCIAGPSRRGALADLFSTHPSMARRVERLSGLAAGHGRSRTGIVPLVAGLAAGVLVVGCVGAVVLVSPGRPPYGAGAERAAAPVAAPAAPGDLPPAGPSTDAPLPDTPARRPADTSPPPATRTSPARPPRTPPSRSTGAPVSRTSDTPPPSPPSMSRTAVAPEPVPAVPSKVTVRAIGRTAVRISWQDNSGNETGFTIDNGETRRDARAGATSYTWRGLAPGTYLCLRVRAYNDSGPSAFAPTSDPFYKCATTPRPAPRGPARLGGVDFDEYCRAIGADGAVLAGQDAYGWRCATDGAEQPLSVTDACRARYGTDAALDKVMNFADPQSWECWRVTRRLGPADLGAYCRSQGASGAVLVDENAYGWRCRLRDGGQGGIQVIDACRWQYGRPAAIDRMADYYRPDSWECWI